MSATATLTRIPQGLYRLPLKGPTDPHHPERLPRARQHFTAACIDLNEGRASLAARRFVEVTRLLSTHEPGAAWAEHFAGLRELAWRNAAIAWRLANEAHVARKALIAALAEDPENELTLFELFDALS